MGLTDVTGVFSRYFAVGFFLPAFISLVALWYFASSEFMPVVLENHSETTQLLILGGVALVAGLVLSGSNYLITRLFEGYPLLRLRGVPVLKQIPRAAIALQARSLQKLRKVRDDEDKPEADRGTAWRRLDRFFPYQRGDLMPTRLGNTIRAFERHSNLRWGLDGVTVWPGIEALLSDGERERLVDAKVDVFVFMNGTIGALLVGVCLVVDKAVNEPHPASHWPLYVLPFVIGYALYRSTLAPAAVWGDVVRSSIDTHRLELYEKLGVRAPSSFTDERELALQLSLMLTFGRPLLPDDLWRADKDDSDEPDEDVGGLLSWLCERRRKGG